MTSEGQEMGFLLAQKRTCYSSSYLCKVFPAKQLQSPDFCTHYHFVISTHTPFLLSLPGAKIYDLDSYPVQERKWTELEKVRFYYDFFMKHQHKFGA